MPHSKCQSKVNNCCLVAIVKALLPLDEWPSFRDDSAGKAQVGLNTLVSLGLRSSVDPFVTYSTMTDDKPQTDEWLSANNAGKLIGVTGKTIIRMTENNEITGYRVGSVWRFKRSDIEAYLEAHRYGPGRQRGY